MYARSAAEAAIMPDSPVTPEPQPRPPDPAAQVTPGPPAGAVTPGVPPTAAGLPPVQPPSGKFIVQLFLVPGLIVGVVVLIFLGFTYLFGGPRSPEAFLKKLDDENPDVRWRAASDLAQTLRRDPRLASDPNFALQLALRLRRRLDKAESAERAFAGRLSSLSPEERRKERKPLEADRNFADFLCSSLGNFIVPAGVPELKEVAVKDWPAEPMARALLRRKAVFALANAGDNLKKFDELAEPDQLVILAGLDQAASDPDFGAWARETRAYLDKRRKKESDAFGVDVVLEKCADDADPDMRELVALAANFWFGTEEQNRRIEDTLLKLAEDRGEGEKAAQEWFEDNPDPTPDRSVCKVPGLTVRLNALTALARRGSPRFPANRLATLLNADDLRREFVIIRADGTESPDEARIIALVDTAQQAIDKLKEARPETDVSAVEAAVKKVKDTSPSRGPAAGGLGTTGWLVLIGLLLGLAAFLYVRWRHVAAAMRSTGQPSGSTGGQGR
jgi:hypothetical protein